jgi:prepilin-type N-terminal cleavage/methylation domain-containing protein
MKKDKGFTLIELMIAITILGLLLFTGSFVYSTISNRWDQELGEFNQHFDEARSLILLQTLLSGVMPYVVRTGEQNDSLPTMFFVGDQDSLLAVSRGGLINSDYPEIFRLTALPNQNDKFDLIYQSVSTQTTLLLNTLQEIEFLQRIVLMHDLDDIQFRYFGWPSFQSKNLSTEENAAAQSWYARYSGVDKQLNPEKIEVQLTQGDKVIRFSVRLDESSQRFLEHYLSDLSES